MFTQHTKMCNSSNIRHYQPKTSKKLNFPNPTHIRDIDPAITCLSTILSRNGKRYWFRLLGLCGKRGIFLNAILSNKWVEQGALAALCIPPEFLEACQGQSVSFPRRELFQSENHDVVNGVPGVPKFPFLFFWQDGMEFHRPGKWKCMGLGDLWRKLRFCAENELPTFRGFITSCVG